MTRTQKTALLLTATAGGAWLIARPLGAFSFADKVVLVTGGSRGLGLVLARQLTREGARVAICARRQDELSRASEDLRRLGAAPLAQACDVSNSEQVQNTVARIEKDLGPIDVVINNAGIICVGPISTMTRHDFEEALAVSFWGAYNVVEAVVPGMRARRSGRIVNISSIGGLVSIPHLVPYSVGKHALVGYSRGLRAELANNGITVTTICPGLMRTGSPKHGFFKGNYEAEYTWFKAGDSLPLLTISAEHAARAILNASRHGKAEAVLSIPAKAAALMQGIAPELTATLTSITNRLLPRPGDHSTEAHEGSAAEPAHVPAFVTAMTDSAAQRNAE